MSFRYTSKKYERDLCEEHIVRVDHGGSCNRKVIVACTVIIGFILYWLSLISEDGSLPIAIAAILVLLCCIYLHFIQVYQESLLVVASTGVQFTTTYQTGRKKHLFIPISSIHDIVISEAVTMVIMDSFQR
uniref:Uncharacterized protein LOC102805353 n=1 Tax=Saccoglossus kowalevskii TaxID=10224 RepID=A0ABM0MKE0_SACKO|nr:PREDICTED: uncharacterized protein LOC102805353 [Saccoglossus kowalevskii]